MNQKSEIPKSPLFNQIVAIMAVAVGARDFVKSVENNIASGKEVTAKTYDKVSKGLTELKQQLFFVDYNSGAEIMKAAAQACDLANPAIDIICPRWGVNLNQQAKTFEVKGLFAGEKGAIINFSENNGTEFLTAIINALDTLYPHRLVGGKIPKLIMNQ